MNDLTAQKIGALKQELDYSQAAVTEHQERAHLAQVQIAALEALAANPSPADPSLPAASAPNPAPAPAAPPHPV